MTEYKVDVYNQGRVATRGKIEATSPLSAAKLFKKNGLFSHVRVDGRFRYNKKFKALPKKANVYKIVHGGFPSLLAMFDNVSEIYHFSNEKALDQCIEEVSKCTVFPSAEFVKASPEPTDTTASLGVTGGSESGLTSKKTLSGSATNATWQDSLIPDGIAKISGTGKSKDTARNTWKAGYTPSPSKPSPILFATVKNISNVENIALPWIAPEMLELIGKTVKVERYRPGLYDSVGWIWKKEWLDFDNAMLKVKDGIKKGTHIEYTKSNGGTVAFTYKSSMSDTKGHAVQCPCGCGAWRFGNGFTLPVEWLEVMDENELDGIIALEPTDTIATLLSSSKPKTIQVDTVNPVVERELFKLKNILREYNVKYNKQFEELKKELGK